MNDSEFSLTKEFSSKIDYIKEDSISPE